MVRRILFVLIPMFLISFATHLSGANAHPVKEVRGLVISITFPDTKPEYLHPLADIEAMFNDRDYAKNPSNIAKNNGSLWQYFHDVSNGQFSLTHAVAEYAAPKPARDYLHESVRRTMVKQLLDEAILHLRDEVKFDFSQLTLGDDGAIMALGIFYASNANPREADFIPGYAAGSPKDYGDFKTKRFHIVPQRNFFALPDGTRPLVLRTFAHEAGHAVLFWPDLYDIDGSSRGLGHATLMSGTGDYHNPLLPAAYLRGKEGWIPVVDITDDAPGTLRKAPGDGELTFRYNHPTNPNEYFLIDACFKAARKDGRFNTTRNAHEPPEGLRIWHVDERGVNSREAMTPTAHYKVSVEQADGKFDLERGGNGGDAGDTFHAGGATVFSDSTTPDARWWDGSESGLKISNVGPIGPEMTFITDHAKRPFFVDKGRPVRIRQTLGYLALPAFRYSIVNTSDATMNWKANGDGDWLDVKKRSGHLAPGTSATVMVTIDRSALDLKAGRAYSGTVTIGARGKPVQREISLTLDKAAIVHHWPLDERTGKTAKDRVASLDATTKRAPFNKISVKGQVGRALELSGAEGPRAELDGWNTNAITLTAWVKLSDKKLGRPQKVIYFPNEVVGLSIDTEGALRYNWSSKRSGAAGFGPTSGKWSFIAMTIAPREAKIVVIEPDGEMREKAFVKRQHGPLEMTRFTMGGVSRKDCMDGQIDDVRIYNYPLGADELRALVEGR